MTFKSHTERSNAQHISTPTTTILTITVCMFHSLNCLTNIIHMLQTSIYCKNFDSLLYIERKRLLKNSKRVSNLCFLTKNLSRKQNKNHFFFTSSRVEQDLSMSVICCCLIKRLRFNTKNTIVNLSRWTRLKVWFHKSYKTELSFVNSKFASCYFLGGLVSITSP